MSRELERVLGTIGVLTIIVGAMIGLVSSVDYFLREDTVKTDTCHTIIYSVYGEVETAECVDNLNVGDIVSYDQDGLTIYIKPDLLAVREHTHE